MRLANPEALADDLERNLAGPDNFYLQAIPEQHRLRLPVCGVVSLAIAEALRKAGHKVVIVHSMPQIDADPKLSHVFPVIYDIPEPMIVDAAYSSMLSLTRLTPQGIMLGFNEDVYPDEKVLTFEHGDVKTPGALLATAAVRSLENWQPDDDGLPLRLPALMGYNAAELQKTFGAFWDPQYFQQYRPDFDTYKEGRRLAGGIQRASLRLIDD